MTKRESVLQALYTALGGIAGPDVERESPLPESVPAGGLIILRDGDPGQPDVTLGGPDGAVYSWRHTAEIEVIVQKPKSMAHTTLDDLIGAIGIAVKSNRTLSGAVEYTEPLAPQLSDFGTEGATPFKGATIPLVLYYTSSGALD